MLPSLAALGQALDAIDAKRDVRGNEISGVRNPLQFSSVAYARHDNAKTFVNQGSAVTLHINTCVYPKHDGQFTPGPEHSTWVEERDYQQTTHTNAFDATDWMRQHVRPSDHTRLKRFVDMCNRVKAKKRLPTDTIRLTQTFELDPREGMHVLNKEDIEFSVDKEQDWATVGGCHTYRANVEMRAINDYEKDLLERKERDQGLSGDWHSLGGGINTRGTAVQIADARNDEEIDANADKTWSTQLVHAPAGNVMRWVVKVTCQPDDDETTNGDNAIVHETPSHSSPFNPSVELRRAMNVVWPSCARRCMLQRICAHARSLHAHHLGLTQPMQPQLDMIQRSIYDDAFHCSVMLAHILVKDRELMELHRQANYEEARTGRAAPTRPKRTVYHTMGMEDTFELDAAEMYNMCAPECVPVIAFSSRLGDGEYEAAGSLVEGFNSHRGRSDAAIAYGDYYVLDLGKDRADDPYFTATHDPRSRSTSCARILQEKGYDVHQPCTFDEPCFDVMYNSQRRFLMEAESMLPNMYQTDPNFNIAELKERYQLVRSHKIDFYPFKDHRVSRAFGALDALQLPTDYARWANLYGDVPMSRSALKGMFKLDIQFKVDVTTLEWSASVTLPVSPLAAPFYFAERGLFPSQDRYIPDMLKKRDLDGTLQLVKYARNDGYLPSRLHTSIVNILIEEGLEALNTTLMQGLSDKKYMSLAQMRDDIRQAKLKKMEELEQQMNGESDASKQRELREMENSERRKFELQRRNAIESTHSNLCGHDLRTYADIQLSTHAWAPPDEPTNRFGWRAMGRANTFSEPQGQTTTKYLTPSALQKSWRTNISEGFPTSSGSLHMGTLQNMLKRRMSRLDRTKENVIKSIDAIITIPRVAGPDGLAEDFKPMVLDERTLDSYVQYTYTHNFGEVPLLQGA